MPHSPHRRSGKHVLQKQELYSVKLASHFSLCSTAWHFIPSEEVAKNPIINQTKNPGSEMWNNTINFSRFPPCSGFKALTLKLSIYSTYSFEWCLTE